MLRKYDSSFYQAVAARAEIVAVLVARMLRRYVSVRTLSDVGCGSGTWIRAFLNQGAIHVEAFDLPGAWDSADNSVRDDARIRFTAVDFERENLTLEKCDLVLCLEVLEHLSADSAVRLLDALTANSDLVVFSAAQPGQGGTHHINEQPLRYWLQRYADAGFSAFDVFRPELVRRTDVPRYYSLNLFALARVGSNPHKALSAELNPLNPAKPPDFRTSAERVRFSVVRLLPSRVVTALSSLVRY